MIDHTTELYCIIDDLLKAAGHVEDARRAMSDAEVLTTALVAAQFFGSNMETARRFLQETGLMPRMLSRSRLNCRLHAIADLAYTIFHQLGAVLKEASRSTKYLLDSFPVPVCDNIRISRSRLAKGEQFRGHICSKRRYFYGVKVQVMTTEAGVPVGLLSCLARLRTRGGWICCRFLCPRAANSSWTVVTLIMELRMQRQKLTELSLRHLERRTPSVGMIVGAAITSN